MNVPSILRQNIHKADIAARAGLQQQMQTLD